MRTGVWLVTSIALTLTASASAFADEPLSSAAAPHAEDQTTTMFGPLSQLIGTRWKQLPDEADEQAVRLMSEWATDLGNTVLVRRSVDLDGDVASLTYLQPGKSEKGATAVVVSNFECASQLQYQFNPDGSWTVPQQKTGNLAANEMRDTERLLGQDRIVEEREVQFRDGWKVIWKTTFSRTQETLPQVNQRNGIIRDRLFGSLAQLAGTKWKGEPSEAEKEHDQPADYSEWYWDLGGAVLVNRHVLSDGSYGGITLIWQCGPDPNLHYDYITSANFRTSGTFTLNPDGSWTAEEDVKGLPHILKVRSTGRIHADGTMSSVSEFLGDDGEWGPGHAFTYTQTDAPLPDLVPAGKAPE